MDNLRIVVSCGPERYEFLLTQELVQDLKGVMGLDLYDGLMEVILNEVEEMIKKIVVDKKATIM